LKQQGWGHQAIGAQPPLQQQQALGEHLRWRQQLHLHSGLFRKR
jgi:hypothetical protein